MRLTRALHPNPFEANGMPPTYEMIALVPFQGVNVPNSEVLPLASDLKMR